MDANLMLQIDLCEVELNLKFTL